MEIETLVEHFLQWCLPRRAAATVKHYRSRLRPFVERFRGRELADLTPLEIQTYLDNLNTDYAPDTQRANIVVVETLQSWAVKMKIIEQPILSKIEKPAGRLRERIPTNRETTIILRHASPEFRLVYQALRQSGARPNEIARATIEDIKDGRIELTEHKTAKKTGKPRIIPIGQKFGKMIEQAVGDRKSGPIFLSPRGKAWTAANLSSNFRRIRNRMKLKKDLVLYLTRHEHATIVCDKAGIHAASRALGHSNIQTTMRYAKDQLDTMQQNQDLV